MTRFLAFCFVAAAAALIAVPAFAADQPAPKAEAPAAKTEAPAAKSDSHDWFPNFFDQCRQHGVAEAECQKRYDDRKAEIVELCKQEGIKGDDDCHKWLDQKRTEQIQTRRMICKDNNISGDEACQKWFDQKQAEFIANFQAQCQKDNLTEEQCHERFATNVKKTQDENRKFVADCQAQGGTHDQCMQKLLQMRRAKGQQEGAASPSGNAQPSGDSKGPPSSDKGKALPPPQ